MEESCQCIAIRTKDKCRISVRLTVAAYVPGLLARAGIPIFLSFVFWFSFPVTRALNGPGTSIAGVVIFVREFNRVRLRDGLSGKSWGGRRTLGDNSVCVRPFFIPLMISRKTPALWHLPHTTRQLYSGVKFVTHVFDIWATYRSARVLKKVNAMTILKPVCNPGRGERDDSNKRIKKTATEQTKRAQAHSLGGAAMGPLAKSLPSPRRATGRREPGARRSTAGLGFTSLTRLRA